MCGIAGLVASGCRVEASDLSAMARSIAHRGPDDHGQLLWQRGETPSLGRNLAVDRADVGLAHRRLSIVDLSEAGWQPMTTPDGRFHIVFNGEIYNFEALRTELERDGDIFVSTSDTEVLLKGLARHGRPFLERLSGMYAFALLDVHEGTLLLARDPFGIKPLYYTAAPGRFAFASEIKALLTLDWVSRRSNPERVRRYLAFGDTDGGTSTFFADVAQLPVGSWMEIDIDGSVRQTGFYWQPPTKRDLDIGFDEAAAELQRKLLDSVNLHRRADVPVAALLSGGIDSSGLVGALRHAAGPHATIDTFTFATDDPQVDEYHWAELMSAAATTRAHVDRPTPEDLIAVLDQLVDSQDEPFGSTSIFAQYRVFSLVARSGIKVVLDGQGADELFAGYRPHLAARLAGLVRRGNVGGALALSKAACAPGLIRHVLAGLVPTGLAHPLLRRWYVRRLAECGLRRDWFDAHCPGASPVPLGGWKNLSDALLDDLTRSNLPGLLRYEDRSSMGWSVESRVPFLMKDIAEFAFRLPERHLIGPDGTSKHVLRAALRGLVPDAILDRRDKIGFQTPQTRWLGAVTPWLRSALTSNVAQTLSMLDCAALLDRPPSTGWVAGGAIWRAVNLIRWTALKDVVHD